MRIVEYLWRVLCDSIDCKKRDAVIARFVDRERLDERAWIAILRETVAVTDPVGGFLYHWLPALGGLPLGLIRPDDLLDEDLQFWTLRYEMEFEVIETMAYGLQIPMPPFSILSDLRTVADLARNVMRYVCEVEAGQR